jgi:hypothetical protein
MYTREIETENGQEKYVLIISKMKHFNRFLFPISHGQGRSKIFFKE